MRKVWLAGTITAAALAGCTAGPDRSQTAITPIAPSNTAAASTQQTQTTTTIITPRTDETIATVGNLKISRAELDKPLLEAYGFNMLMLLIQRDIAKNACEQQGITLSPADLDNEWKWTLDTMFSTAPATEDKQKLLDQYLTTQPKAPGTATTRAEYNVLVETNAYLRKLAEPSMKLAITDDILRQDFDETYGGQRRVRHIAVTNPQDALKYKAAIEAGQDFGALARRVSVAQSRDQGGELAPFTRDSTKLPKAFRDAAWGLKNVGDISEPVQAEQNFHIIQLEQKIEPKAVKFEDVKDSLRQDLQDKAIMEAVRTVRGRLAQEALAELKVSDPVLNAEFQKRMGFRNDMITDREKIRQQLDKERAAAATQSTTAPAATTKMPATAPANPPATSKPVPTVKPAPVVPVAPHAAPPASAPVPPPVVAPTTAPAATVPAVPPHAMTPPPAPAPATTAPATKP